MSEALSIPFASVKDLFITAIRAGNVDKVACILKLVDDPKALCNDKSSGVTGTSLFMASRLNVTSQRVAMVKLLLENGVDPNGEWRGYTTALQAHCDGVSLDQLPFELFQFYVEKGLDIERPGGDGISGLARAQRNVGRIPHLAATIEFIKREQQKLENERRQQELQKVRQDRIDQARTALENGGDPNAAWGTSYRSALHAHCSGVHLEDLPFELIDLYFAKGINFEAKDAAGCTMLEIAERNLVPCPYLQKTIDKIERLTKERQQKTERIEMGRLHKEKAAADRRQAWLVLYGLNHSINLGNVVLHFTGACDADGNPVFKSLTVKS